MFEFDAGKLIIIGIVALIVIGPKELPRVLRQVGQAMAKLRRMAADFQGQFMDAMREAEVADIKAEAAKLAESAKLDAGFNPIAELKSELTRAIDLSGQVPEATAEVAAADPAATAVPHEAGNSIALPQSLELAEEDEGHLAVAASSPCRPEVLLDAKDMPSPEPKGH